MLSFGYKIWLVKSGRAFGQGSYRLMQGIKEGGSLNSAAKKIGMSYSQAHAMIKKLEDQFGHPLLIRKAGGSGGGGSYLTDEGIEMMNKYEAFHEECEELLEKTFAKYFLDS